MAIIIAIMPSFFNVTITICPSEKSFKSTSGATANFIFIFGQPQASTGSCIIFIDCFARRTDSTTALTVSMSFAACVREEEKTVMVRRIAENNTEILRLIFNLIPRLALY